MRWTAPSSNCCREHQSQGAAALFVLLRKRPFEAVEAVAPSDAGTARQALVATAVVTVREIQVLQAPHIADADDAVMTHGKADGDL
jgi:hypothetical protein